MPEHLIVLHRWTDTYADYASYLDHDRYRVSYVTTPRAEVSLPASAACVELVSHTENRAEVRAAVDRLVARHGRPARIIALHEVDLDFAAELRQELDLPGDTPAALDHFRDKLAMARRLAESGVPTPASAAAPDHGAVARFAADHGWPVILKPVRGTASAHVTRLDAAADLARYAFPEGTAMMVQSYLPHAILHVDGVAADGALLVWRASRYVNTCLDFTRGGALGSVEIDDPALLDALGPFTERALAAMSREPWVFHLELFAAPEDAEPGFHVLEVGARPGGAEVPFIWREVHGVDLMAAAVDVQMGRALPRYSLAPVPGPQDCGGWLLVPTPAVRPCLVLAADSQSGLPHGPYAERLPVPGELLQDLPGYEHSGARFRFRGSGSAAVQQAVERTAARLDLRCRPTGTAVPGPVVIVGTGGRAYREYALEDASAHGSVVMVNDGPATWEASYLAAHRVVDLADGTAIAQAVRAALGEDGPAAGILTWSEVLLERTAEAAAQLGLAHMTNGAVRNCRDKFTTRRLLEKAGVPSARYEVAHGIDEAVDAAARIGYPVVVKPRALAGSSGVVLARTAEELRRLHRHAAEAEFTGLDPLEGLLVEEYLDGPELSVDSVVLDGTVHCVNLARKRIGYAPFFEEVGHLVCPWRHEPWAAELTEMLARIHAALEVDTGVTHAELRLTRNGPRLVELNGRLGGDYIPLLGKLATGVDLTAAAMDVSRGAAPRLRPDRDLCAEVRFCYPAQDGVVDTLDVSEAARVPGIERAVALAEPGQQLLLPPRAVVPRLAALVAVGADPDACSRALDEAERLVAVSVSPIEEP